MRYENQILKHASILLATYWNLIYKSGNFFSLSLEIWWSKTPKTTTFFFIFYFWIADCQFTCMVGIGCFSQTFIPIWFQYCIQGWFWALVYGVFASPITWYLLQAILGGPSFITYQASTSISLVLAQVIPRWYLSSSILVLICSYQYCMLRL